MKLILLVFAIIKAVVGDESKSYIAPSIFVNHGAGPLPVYGDKNNSEIAESLRNISKYVEFDRVKAVIVVTAHREEKNVVISSGDYHELVYDYTNFPPETYLYKHNAPGAPELARQVQEALNSAGIQASLDSSRGWDHGTFIPMMLADPTARIPILQVSILNNQNAIRHFELGRALYPFRTRGVAIVGSGMSYHNMAELDRAIIENDGVIVNDSFHNYLKDVCTSDEEGRRRILKWEEERGALEAHPHGEADHLMPLIVNLGAANSRGKVVFDSVYNRKFRLAGFVWE